MHFSLEQSNTNSTVKETACFLKHLGFCKTEEGSSDSYNYLHIIATHQFSVQIEKWNKCLPETQFTCQIQQ